MKEYSSYKKTGIDWLPLMPSHWKLDHLRNFLSMVSVKDKADKTLLSVTREKGVIVRDVDDAESNHNFIPDDLSGYKYVQPGQFVINKMKSWQGSYGVSKYEGIVSPAYYVCDLQYPNKEFFSRAIRSRAYVSFFAQWSKGIRVGQWDLEPNALKSIPFFVPTAEEQEQIMRYLDEKTIKIDECICLRERELQTLNELKQAEIASVVTRGLNPDVPMKDSGIPWIGQIPAHWDIKRLGTRFHSRTEVNSDLEFLKAFKFNYGAIVPKDEVGFSEEYADTYVKYTKVTTNDIMINGLNLNYDFVSQRVAIVPAPGIITSAYLVLRPYPYTYSPYFCYLFKAMDSMKLFHGMGTGIRLTLSFRELKKQLIPIPPEKEQKEIVAFIEEKLSKIDTLIDSLNAEIERLKEYKQRLISDVVTGQINVQNETI